MGHAGDWTRRRPDVVVLGAGIVGVSTAYYLNRAGLDVLVLDRLAGPGLETSFANGGQVSASHAEPWANPGAPLKVLRWLRHADSPLLFRPRLDPAQWRWLLSWLVECAPARTRRNTARILELALHSRACIGQIRAEEGLEYDAATRGILHFYRDQREFDAAARVAALMRAHGCARELVDRARILALEPAFADGGIDQVVGGTYTAADESGDAHAFTAGLAAVCAARGVRFRWQTEVTALHADGDGLAGIEVKDLATARYARLPARRAVVALAAWSPALLRPLGIRLNIYPAKGYSITIPDAGAGAPRVSLTDDERKLVFSRLGDRLRVAGTAELAGFDRRLDAGRVAAMVATVRALFPTAGDYAAATAWTGLRPTTPSNVPYLGASPVGGLYLNTGHGTLGWTMGPGSGERLAAQIAAAAAGARRDPAPARTLLPADA